jgi:hypothetical protein
MSNNTILAKKVTYLQNMIGGIQMSENRFHDDERADKNDQTEVKHNDQPGVNEGIANNKSSLEEENQGENNQREKTKEKTTKEKIIKEKTTKEKTTREKIIKWKITRKNSEMIRKTILVVRGIK